MGTDEAKDAAAQGAEVIRLRRRFDDDQALVAGLVARDPAAAADLHDRFGRAVNRRVWRLLGADAEHDDVVHEVFVQALSSISRLKDPGALEGWLMGIAVNTVRQELRRRRYDRALFRAVEPPDVPCAGARPDEQGIARRFYDAVSRLDADERIALVLRFVEGASLDGLAAAMGCSLATAKRRLARARAHFLLLATQDAVLASFLDRETDDG
jgi:RNA polymerase sigma-70 factor, ECF subfamily